MAVRHLAAALLAATAATCAFAQAAEPNPTACIDVDDDRLRLACYDRAHGRALRESPPPPVTAAPAASPALAASAAGPGPSRFAGTQRLPSALRLDELWDLDGNRRPLFEPRPYKLVYLLPATWTDRVNRRPASPSPEHSVSDDLALKSVEAKYQLSLKARLSGELPGTSASFWGGYTQSSRWQVYNLPESRPFRETNYEPELMLVWPLHGQVAGWQLQMASVSLNHQSNGRSLPLSRSWNRLIGTVAAERGEWSIELRPWLRIYERRKDDDNPDIEDHIGRGELRIARHWNDHALALQLRHSLRFGERSYGSAQLDWVFPIDGALHGVLQVFDGHGESMIDYNRRQTKIGLGITIAGWR